MWDMPHVIFFVSIALAVLLSKLLSVSTLIINVNLYVGPISIHKKARRFYRTLHVLPGNFHAFLVYFTSSASIIRACIRVHCHIHMHAVDGDPIMLL